MKKNVQSYIQLIWTFWVAIAVGLAALYQLRSPPPPYSAASNIPSPQHNEAPAIEEVTLEEMAP